MPHRSVAAIALAACLAGRLQAQAATPAPAPQPPGAMPEVGQMAPDFLLPASTRFGQLARPAGLSDFRGKTVVLAFFYQARTKG